MCVCVFMLETLSKLRVMADAFSLRPLRAEVRFQTQTGSRGICGGKSGTRTGFYLRVHQVPPSIPHQKFCVPLISNMAVVM